MCHVFKWIPIRVFDFLRGSFLEKEMTVLMIARERAMTFEKAVACLGRNPKNNRENGTVIAPPEIPEIDPIPESKEIKITPAISISDEVKNYHVL
jgi:hypothetical protein